MTCYVLGSSLIDLLSREKTLWMVLMFPNCSTNHFDYQNTGNQISEKLNFKISFMNAKLNRKNGRIVQD